MADLGGPLGREASDAKLTRYMTALADHGFSRWAMEDASGAFLGYVGMLPIAEDHPLGPGVEIGWRFRREAWGRGFATEGARAALAHGFDAFGFDEILAFTAPDNLRSQAAMTRLGLARDESRDFVGAGGWRGWVWSARRRGQP
jgi:RimJ/RimL family protein N-acetyltransferase